MKCETIADQLALTEQERSDYLLKVGVIADLDHYFDWLRESETPTEVVSTLRRDKKRKAGIHPSSACKKDVCLLRLYYECTHEIQPLPQIDNESQRIFDIGTLLHDTYQTHFKNMYEDQFQSEVWLTDKDMSITSHTDGIFSFDSVRFVLEMKSIKEGGNYGWEKVQIAPFEDNVRQAHFYMRMADTPFGLIFYINKNSGKLKEHAIVYDPRIWDDIYVNVVSPVLASVASGNHPTSSPSWGCRWCPFKHQCPAVRRVTTRGYTRAWTG